MTIRLLTADDAEAYWPLRLRSLVEHPHAFGSDAQEWRGTSMEEVKTRLYRPNGFMLGAFVDGALIGNAGAFREERTKLRHKAWIGGVYVAPEARGRGIGHALVSAAMERARTWDGVTQLHLSVAVPNEAARQLYLSLGFQVYGLEPRAIRIEDRFVDEEHMVLILT